MSRVIAFYLPQFHPIPENDEWWGKGFTEWTNVGKAKPLFRGHYQPRVPADLGYYDLRIPEIREQQVEMARYAGVEGFCYWHYWFGGGKRLLDRPFKEVLESGKPDFPFCLGWANETWSGIWHGDANRILIKQDYLGVEDYTNHFYEVLPAFKDPRYIRVANKPLFYVYKPMNIPDTELFIDCWQKLAIENGLLGVHFVGQAFGEGQVNDVLNLGYDASHGNWQRDVLVSDFFLKALWNKLMETFVKGNFKMSVFDYGKYSSRLFNKYDGANNVYPTILSGWDNSPRSGRRGLILKNYKPRYFKKHVVRVLEQTKNKNPENNIIFLKSWNEWAEGNYVEPDLKFGWQFLDILNGLTKK